MTTPLTKLRPELAELERIAREQRACGNTDQARAIRRGALFAIKAAVEKPR